MKRNVRKRLMANERERERTKSLNQALEILRDRLPAPEAEKRSKIQTLKMAKLYIEFLTRCKQMAQQQQQFEQNNSKGLQDTTSGQEDEDQQCEQQSQNNNKALESTDQATPLTFLFYQFRIKSQSSRSDLDSHSEPSNH